MTLHIDIINFRIHRKRTIIHIILLHLHTMETKTINTSDSELFEIVEHLLTDAFPEEERRPLEAFRRIADTDSRFDVMALYDGDTPVGFITVWDFGQFRYVEHFAIMPEMRCRNYGARALEALRRSDRRSIVLEVELPVDDLTRRRVAFYTRAGFSMLPDEYIQPPYRPGGASLPMKIMAWTPEQTSAPDFGLIRSTLHREVYGVTDAQ